MALALAARMATPKVPGDFQVYMAGARALVSGRSLYDVGIKSVVGILPFTYPPFAGVLLIPLLHLPLRTAFAVWGLVQVVALAAMSWVIAGCLPGIAGRRAPGRLGTWWLALGIFTASLAFEPVAENFHYGQINILVVLLVLTDTVLVTRGRGVLTGLAAGIKVTPGIFILLMVTTRRWRDLLLAFAGLGFSVVVGALFGVGQEWRYWTREVFLTSRVGDPARTPNASLNGIAQRALGVPESRYVWASVAVLVLISGVWIATVWWRRNHLISGTALGATALVIAPISWTHHWIWAVPLTASLAALSVRARRCGTPREFWSLVAVTVIVAFPYVGHARRWLMPLTAKGSVGESAVAASYAAAAIVGLVALALSAPRYARTEDRRQDTGVPGPAAQPAQDRTPPTR